MPGNTKITGRFRAVIATVGIAIVLTACGTGPDAHAALETVPVTNVVEGQPLSPAFVAVVEIDKLDQVTSAYPGARMIRDKRLDNLSISSGSGINSVVFMELTEMPVHSLSNESAASGIVFEPNQDRFMTSASRLDVYGTELETQGRSTVWAEGSSKVWAEGRSTVWAEGRSTVWAEGRSTVWAEGRSTVWAEGEFMWMPENSDVWDQINLRDGHSEAPNLGNGIVVAVIDTGVDVTHPALEDAISSLGYNFVDNNEDPSEVLIEDNGNSYGHGTVVADIVRQIAPRATILPIRALDSDGSGDVLNVVRAVYYATEHADIINLSLGGREESPALSEAVRYANSQGVFVTISAGNDDDGNGSESPPNFPSRIAADSDLNYVISVTSLDGDDFKSAFSNYGVEAEIAAPGEDIHGPYPDYGLARWSGTSMAAPQVAGALALALGERDLDVRKSRLAREMFEESEDDIYRGSNNRYRDGRQLGAGRLDIEEFLDEVID